MKKRLMATISAAVLAGICGAPALAADRLASQWLVTDQAKKEQVLPPIEKLAARPENLTQLCGQSIRPDHTAKRECLSFVSFVFLLGVAARSGEDRSACAARCPTVTRRLAPDDLP